MTKPLTALNTVTLEVPEVDIPDYLGIRGVSLHVPSGRHEIVILESPKAEWSPA